VRKRRREIITVDCETDPFDGTTNIGPFVWDAFDGNIHHTFDDTVSFVEWLRRQENTIAYAHNGGKFDWIFLQEFIDIGDIMMICGRLARAKIGACEIRDSWNLFPQRLATYQKDDFDYWKLHRDCRDRYMPEIVRYLHSDTEYLYDIVTGFVERFGLHLTTAGCAMRTWTKLNGESRPKSGRRHFESIRPYFYGGRVQAIQPGEHCGDMYFVDVNSAYPFAMMHDHPWGPVDVFSGLSRLTPSMRRRAFVTVDCDADGCFPKRETTGLHFPHARDTYTVTGHEYITACELGLCRNDRIREVKLCQNVVCFRPYVEKFYEMKKAAKKGSLDYLFAKLLMKITA
jgi:hypothetical protein